MKRVIASECFIFFLSEIVVSVEYAFPFLINCNCWEKICEVGNAGRELRSFSLMGSESLVIMVDICNFI